MYINNYFKFCSPMHMLTRTGNEKIMYTMKYYNTNTNII